ncbi:MAG: hypothetical protein K6E18_09105 [Lachnospiraceae bacterium]|nr:hypothetical protein [Lachnospiraceae bacterium]
MHRLETQRQQNSIKSRSRRSALLACLVLALCVIAGWPRMQKGLFAGLKAQAAESGKWRYVMEISTGKHAGDQIEYLRLHYNTDKSLYIFPKQGDLKRYFMNADVDGHLAAQISDYCRYSDIAAFTPEMKLPNGLASNSTVQLLLETDEPIDKIDGISVCAKVEEDVVKWSLHGLRIYDVSALNGLAMKGGFSSELYIDFEGNLLAMTRFEKQAKEGGWVYTWKKSGTYYMPTDTALADVAVGMTQTETPDVLLQTSGFEPGMGVYAPAKNDIYGFGIEFADCYKAGYESLSYQSKASLRDADYAETMALRLIYADRMKTEHNLVIPVVTNALKWAADDGVGENPVACVAQQGQELFFTGVIPDLVELRQVSLISGNHKAIEACGMNKNPEASSLQNSRADKSNMEEVAISRFALYAMGENTKVRTSLDGAMLRYIHEGKPVFYRKAETDQGITLEAAAETGIRVVKPADDFDFSKAGWSNRQYLIGITTDEEETSGSLSDMTMQLSYVDTLGKKQTTPAYDLMELAKGYYGTWNGDKAPEGEMGYYIGVSPGNMLYVNVALSDVDYFTGVKLSLKNGTDEWKGSGLKIWALDELSAILGDFGGIEAKNGDTDFASDVRFYRNYKGICMLDIKPQTREEKGEEVQGSSLLQDYVTVTPTQSGGWSFMSITMSEVEEQEVLNISERLSYEESLQDFDFAKARKNYLVKVRVKDTEQDEGGNGDCGSMNNFYFQLIFENGTSGIVLANSQLEGDRFESGAVESFVISTGKDLGNLVSVRILPETDKNNEAASDKLCIEEIRVTEQTTLPYADTYVIDQLPNKGWLGGGLTSPTEQGYYDLLVNRNTNELSFLVCLSTGDYAPATSQFKGSMKMRLDYIDTAGRPCYATYDVVEAMYRYYEKERLEEPVDESTSRVVSDPKYMFRGEHTDRFEISLENVRSIYKATLIGEASDQKSEWPVTSLSFSVVEEDGSLWLTNGGEYLRKGKSRFLASNMAFEGGEGVLRTEFEPGQSTEVSLLLQANELAVRKEGSKWLSVYSNEPVNQNDAIAIYVYPASDGKSISDWDLRCRADYTDSMGQSFSVSGQSENANMKKSMDGGEESPAGYFYTDTISGNGIAVLDTLYVEGVGIGEHDDCRIDHALIQQIRGNEVIRTCYLDGHNTRLGSVIGLRATRGQKTADVTQRQVVSLQLSEDTPEMLLTAREQDLAVAISYRSSLDPTGKEIFSPYRYLTDEQIYKIRSGQILEMTFSEPYVKEVTGIRLMSAGDVKGKVDRACVASYLVSEADESSRTLSGWYSFGSGVTLSQSAVTMQSTGTQTDSEKVVWPLELTFTTAGAQGTEESGIDVPVRMTVGYENAYGNAGTMRVEDIRKYITDEENQNFETGSERVVRMLTEGVHNITYIELQPYRSGQTGSSGTSGQELGWNLSKIAAKVGDQAAVMRSVGDRILETAAKRINFNNVKLSVKATYKNLANDANESKSVINDDADFAISSGITVTFHGELYGSDQGIETLVERRVGDSVQTENNLLTRKSSSTTAKTADFEFTPPRNISGSNIVYYVTIRSKENAEASCRFSVTVQPEAQVSTTTQNGTTQNGSGQNGTTQSGGSQNNTTQSTAGGLQSTGIYNGSDQNQTVQSSSSSDGSTTTVQLPE